MIEQSGRAVCSDCAGDQCYSCDEYFDEDDITVINGRNYCDTCRDEIFTLCESCDEWVRVENCQADDEGDNHCRSCYDDLYTQCDRCGTDVPIDDTESLSTGRTDMYGRPIDQGLCPDCFDQIGGRCQMCGEKYLLDEGGQPVCGLCGAQAEKYTTDTLTAELLFEESATEREAA